MINAYVKMFKNYAEFSGRTNRSDYWFAILANFIVSIILGIIISIAPSLNFLSGIYCLAVLVPSLSIAVRRLHDIGKSGWWYLIFLVPLAGPIILIVFLATESSPDNIYGPNPAQYYYNQSYNYQQNNNQQYNYQANTNPQYANPQYNNQPYGNPQYADPQNGTQAAPSQQYNTQAAPNQSPDDNSL